MKTDEARNRCVNSSAVRRPSPGRILRVASRKAATGPPEPVTTPPRRPLAPRGAPVNSRRMSLSDLLAQNRAWAAAQTARDPDYFARLACGQHGCGGSRAACARESPSGYIGDWLAIAGWAQRAVDARLTAQRTAVEGEAYLRLVVEENVRLQLTHLSHLSVMRDQWSRTPGVPRLHGWVYDIGTGLVKVVASGDTSG